MNNYTKRSRLSIGRSDASISEAATAICSTLGLWVTIQQQQSISVPSGAGKHSSGVLLIPQRIDVGAAIEELKLIWLASEAAE
jgi:hypothetical protein